MVCKFVTFNRFHDIYGALFLRRTAYHLLALMHTLAHVAICWHHTAGSVSVYMKEVGHMAEHTNSGACDVLKFV